MLHIYMDLDDTLILTQQLFEHYKLKCAEFILSRNKEDAALTTDDIIQSFNLKEEENIPLLGFVNERFLKSWGDTYDLYFPEGKERENIQQIASDVFTSLAPLKDGSIEMLEELTDKGYEITTITVGQEDVQNRRIDQVGIRKYFNEVIVVPYKNKDIMKEIIKEKERSVMIGNSMRSDINPSLENGIAAIQVEGQNWFHDITEKVEGGDYAYGTLHEVPRLIEELEERKALTNKQRS